ncbi:hypothetical protein GJAV_G00271890 [Gymnothorax javanicus]|nr:hypothetical protein GJAV_G00271890 [Gymnothorax javanicus]
MQEDVRPKPGTVIVTPGKGFGYENLILSAEQKSLKVDGDGLTLDPNTVHRELSLSEGNRKVTHTPGREEL